MMPLSSGECRSWVEAAGADGCFADPPPQAIARAAIRVVRTGTSVGKLGSLDEALGEVGGDEGGAVVERAQELDQIVELAIVEQERRDRDLLGPLVRAGAAAEV